jgi:hypothetical protein
MKNKVLSLLVVLVSSAPTLRPQSSSTSQISYDALTQMSASGDGLMAGVTAQGAIYLWNGVEWRPLEGQLAQVSIGSKNDIWGVTTGHDVWRINNSQWEKMPGKMSQVAVAKGGGGVVALDVNARPAYWNGGGWVPYPNGPILKQIDIGKPGVVYGLGPDDTIYRWLPNISTWRILRGQLRQISVAADGTIGGTNSINQVWTQSGADVDAELDGSPSPTAWVPRQSQVKDILVISSHATIIRNIYQDLSMQLPSPLPATGSFQVPESYTVAPLYASDDGITLDPQYQYVPKYDPTKCVVLSGSLKLDLKQSAQGAIPGNQENQASDQTTCLKGTFAKIVPPARSVGSIVEAQQITQFFSPLVPDEGIPFQYVGRPDGAVDDPSATCQPAAFRQASAHTSVDFQLPAGSAARGIHVPRGTYSVYVFPTCHRVWWELQLYVCNPETKSWEKAYGNTGADVGCDSDVPSSPYIKVGTR